MSGLGWPLAHVALARADLTDPVLAGFAADIATVNGLAERASGFVWHVDGHYSWRHLQLHGPTPTAFTFGRPFASPSGDSSPCAS